MYADAYKPVASSKLKPLAKATRLPLLKTRLLQVLPRALEEELFRGADVLSEGAVRGAGAGPATYFGSTMISIDLARVSGLVRGVGDRVPDALVRAVDGSVRVRLRAMRLARAEAARRVHGRSLGAALCEVRVRSGGLCLYIDVDLEMQLGVSSAAARPR